MAHRDDSLFVFSRVDYDAGVEIVVAINAEEQAQKVNVPVDGRADAVSSLLGLCRTTVTAPTSYAMTVPALDVVVCKSEFEVD